VPLLLRAIRKNRWYKSEAVAWLPEGEIQADPLGDLATSNNTLSVWQVEDDDSNLEKVITALASSRASISNLDYAVLNIDLLTETGIKIEINPGETPYELANVWHRDLIELTATKIVRLAETMMQNSHILRIPEKRVLDLIKDAVHNGQIDKTKLHPGIANKLG
jgi:hypothetical protein